MVVITGSFRAHKFMKTHGTDDSQVRERKGGKESDPP